MVYFDVFIRCFTIFQCILIILTIVFDVFQFISTYSNIFRCIWVYFNIFQIYLQYVYDVYWCVFSIFQCVLMYLKVYEYLWVCLNVRECIYDVYQLIYLYLLTLKLGFHHHILIIQFFSWTPTYTFVFHYLQWLPSQHALLLPTFLQFPLIHSNFHTNHENVTY
jgi:hypothetical protein